MGKWIKNDSSLRRRKIDMDAYMNQNKPQPQPGMSPQMGIMQRMGQQQTMIPHDPIKKTKALVSAIQVLNQFAADSADSNDVDAKTVRVMIRILGEMLKNAQQEQGQAQGQEGEQSPDMEAQGQMMGQPQMPTGQMGY